MIALRHQIAVLLMFHLLNKMVLVYGIHDLPNCYHTFIISWKNVFNKNNLMI